MHLCMYIRTYVYVCAYIYMDVCCMHSARTGYIYECVCTQQDTYTNVYRTHMHMHAYMHAYIHTLVGSGPLFPQIVLQCLCSCASFRRILCSIAICVFMCMCVWSSTVIITAKFCAQVCMRHWLHVSAN